MTDHPQLLDLGPAAQQVKELLNRITDGQLADPTPCADTSVAALLDHFMGLTVAFTNAAQKRKEPGVSGPPPEPSAEHLDPDWRQKLPLRLDELVSAWKDPSAWQGEAEAGGVKLPAEIMGVVALDELVIHSWDLSMATGQLFEADQKSLEAVIGMLSQFPDEQRAEGSGFGPIVETGPDAPLLMRAIGLSGRDPYWVGA